MRSPITIIAAMDLNRGIGFKRKLPWQGELPDDMKHFRNVTLGKCVIFGRRTMDGIGRALPGRTCIVLSRDPSYKAPAGCGESRSLEEALDIAEVMVPGSEILVAGGGIVYQEALPLADSILLTVVHGIYETDVCMPEFPGRWITRSTDHHPADAKNRASFTILRLERQP